MANPTLFGLDVRLNLQFKTNRCVVMIWTFLYLFSFFHGTESVQKCGSNVCEFGQCVNGTCVCEPGWSGSNCGHCVGRVRLTKDHGFISDGTGNYSVDSKCAWLVDTGEVNKTIRFHLEEFATECGWDHIFIHDGDSAFSPLTAAYSGRMVRRNSSYRHDEEMQTETATHTGKAFIYFFSDAAYNIDGFNISYRFGSCPKGCSGHGVCLNDTEGTCQCDEGWDGPSCSTVNCTYHCINNSTQCSPLCYCFHDIDDVKCVERRRRGYWGPVNVKDPPHPGTAHQTVVIGDYMWSVGGYNFNIEPFQSVYRFDFVNSIWEYIETTGDIPETRYDHSVVVHQENLYMFGGVVDKTITNDLYVLDTKNLTWTKLDQISVTGTWRLPAAVSGHTANIVNDTMVVFFGHSPVYSYMRHVQEYDIKKGSWRVAETSGALVKGAYGHSSVFDEQSGLIYVFGGITLEEKSAKITDQLLTYDFDNKYWSILERSHSPRYLHSAVIINGMLLVFGGNTHNDTLGNQTPKCYSSDLMSYDLSPSCDSWKTIPKPDPRTVNRLARYGHTSVVYKSEVYIFGGFSGLMLNDLYKFTPGNCSLYSDKFDCNQTVTGVKCDWIDDQCVANSNRECTTAADNSDRSCGELTTCRDCYSSKRSCNWCGTSCVVSDKQCPSDSKVVNDCSPEGSHSCNLTHNCELCQTDLDCDWANNKCQYAVSNSMSTDKPVKSSSVQCKAPCSKHTTCSNCTSAECLWCTNLESCVDINSYTASFPYGICMEWTMSLPKCPETNCENLKTCSACQSNPRCGWCNNPEETGLGKCMKGGDSGDLSDSCPSNRWFFTECPLCQCNGHSACKNGTDICTDCKSFTTGRHCDTCQLGYFGDPKIGGACKPCECNGQADFCATDTGDCFCRTKGAIGPRCDKCDERNKYYPKGGICYYELATDYQYTFDISKDADQHFTQINFMNIPIEPDRDVEFRLNCSVKAMVNITWQSNSSPEEKLVMAPLECGYVDEKFDHNSYNFAKSENTTFRIYIYAFKTPFWLQISFVVISSFDIFLFVAIFIGCFLSLMLLAALLWKIKQRYDIYRRRQRMVVEMEQMASRPFATACVEIEPRIEAFIGPGAIPIKREPPDVKRKKVKTSNKPSPIAYEPLYGNKVAVISMLVRLPAGDEDYTPMGQCGLAVASALITMGSQRKPSLEKGDKSRNKRHTHPPNPDTCI